MTDLLQNVLGNTNSLYIDPSSVTIIASSISAIAIALGATFIIIWRRAKNKVAKTFNIDKNANKEVEDDIIINEKDSESK